MELKSAKRIKAIMFIFAALIAALAARAAYIQIYCHEDFKAAALSQYKLPVEGLDTRGTILDRNSRPLTGGTKEYYYIIPSRLKDSALDGIMRDLGADQAAADTKRFYVYRSEAFEHESAERIKREYGGYIFENSARYADEQTACHLVGYLKNDGKTGVSGLELLYQNKLKADKSGLALFADSAGNIIRGVKPVVTEETVSGIIMTDRSVVTTIDRRLQRICEESLQSRSDSGAAVVLDPFTGEILAWASAPAFNPNHIEDYINAEGDCLINKVCQTSYAPGSVFKIVTAAAAMESGRWDENRTIECCGHTIINGVELSCAAGPEEGHGKVNLKEAMACSCNCYFAEMAKETGLESVLEKARQMGLGKNLLDGFPEECGGNIPDETQVNESDTSNIAIGQGAIEATPLQIAVMTASVANGGMCIKPVLLLGEETSGRRIMKKDTAEFLSETLEAVMKEGTGAAAEGEWEYPVWGKTGTAETGSTGNSNCWFTGYCFADGRLYVITVMIQGGGSGAASAMPVFRDIADFINAETAF